MSYKRVITKSAEKEIKELPTTVLQRIHNKIMSLSENPYQRGHKKLKGHLGFRIRAGKYRIVYDIDKKSRTITIYGVRHRRKAYR